MSRRKERVMSDTPTYRTLHEAITIIRENWPGASDWREIRELEGLLPDDPLAMETPLPEAARNSVRQLLERLPIEGGTPPPPPRGGALKACLLLGLWSGFEPAE